MQFFMGETVMNGFTRGFWVCPMFEQTHSMYWAIPTLMPGSWKLLLLEANAKNVPWSLAMLGWGITPSSYISPTYPSIYPEISEWHVKCGVGWTSLLTTVGKGPLFLRGLSIRLLYIYMCVCVRVKRYKFICIYIYMCVYMYMYIYRYRYKNEIRKDAPWNNRMWHDSIPNYESPLYRTQNEKLQYQIVVSRGSSN